MSYEVNIIGSSGYQSQASILTTTLRSAGLHPRLSADGGERLPFALVVAFLGVATPEVLLEVGYCIGAKRPVIVLTDAHFKHLTLLKDIHCINIEDPDFALIALEAARSLLGVRGLPPGVDRSAETLSTWLSEDWARLRELESFHLVNLVKHLFEQAGCNAFQSGAGDEPDLQIQAGEHSARWLVHCKASVKDSPIGIGVVQRLHSACVRTGSDFAMLFSNSILTRSAKAWAAECAPPVHVLEKTQLEALLRAALQAKRANDPSASARHVFTVLPNSPEWTHQAGSEPWFHLAGIHGTPLAVRSGSKVGETGDFDAVLAKCTTITVPEQLGVVAGLRSELRSRGIRLGHIGESGPSSLRDLAHEVRESHSIVLLASLSSAMRTKWDHQVLQVVAHEVARSDHAAAKLVIVVAPKNAFNRLRIPNCISRVAFVDPDTENWKSSVSALVRQHTETQRTRSDEIGPTRLPYTTESSPEQAMKRPSS